MSLLQPSQFRPQALSPAPEAPAGSKQPREEAGADFPAASSLGCPQQLPLSFLLAPGPEPGEPPAPQLPWALLPSQEPEGGTEGPWKQEWRERDRAAGSQAALALLWV